MARARLLRGATFSVPLSELHTLHPSPAMTIDATVQFDLAAKARSITKTGPRGQSLYLRGCAGCMRLPLQQRWLRSLLLPCGISRGAARAVRRASLRGVGDPLWCGNPYSRDDASRCVFPICARLPPLRQFGAVPLRGAVLIANAWRERCIICAFRVGFHKGTNIRSFCFQLFFSDCPIQFEKESLETILTLARGHCVAHPRVRALRGVSSISMD